MRRINGIPNVGNGPSLILGIVKAAAKCLIPCKADKSCSSSTAMERTSVQSQRSSWLIPFLLGVSLSALLFVFYPKSNETVDTAPLSRSLTPAMDRLNDYACRRAETKHIILGGQEDGYSPQGDETINALDLVEYYKTRTGRELGITVGRNYDDVGYDQIFVDRLTLPNNVAHGIFVMRAKQLGSLNNDFIKIGDLLADGKKAHISQFLFRRPEDSHGLQREGEVFFSSLKGLRFEQRMIDGEPNHPQDENNLFDFLRTQDNQFGVIASDDSAVDVIGVAICTEPDRNYGNSFLVSQIDDSTVYLSCNAEDGQNHCQPFSGDTRCNVSLPLACYADKGIALTQNVNSDPRYLAWSGGHIEFTAPLRGNAISSQAEAHNICRLQFGDDFRAANIHDGFINVAVMGKGHSGGFSKAWVDSNTEPYGNCWPRQDDYSSEQYGDE